jgi:hypothetical protein
MLLETDTHLIVDARPSGERERRLAKAMAVVVIGACTILALDRPIWWLGVVGLVATLALGRSVLRRQGVRIDKRSRSIRLGQRDVPSKQLLCVLATRREVTTRHTSTRHWDLELIERSTEPLFMRAVDAAVSSSNAISTVDEAKGLADALEQFLYDGTRGRTLLVSDTNEAVVTNLARRTSDILGLPLVDACTIPPCVHLPGERAIRADRATEPAVARPEHTDLAETADGLTLTWTQSRYADQLFVLALIILPALASTRGLQLFLQSTVVTAIGILTNPVRRNPLRGHGRNELVLRQGTLSIRLGPLRREQILLASEIVLLRTSDWGVSIVCKRTTVNLPAHLEVAAWLQHELEQRLAPLAESSSDGSMPKRTEP